jgi:thiosulfate reductase cytochrome b subunit
MSETKHDRRVKTALDESRLLILGAQILFGFHLNAAFQKGFDTLVPAARALHAISFLLMALAVALLVAPSLQHRIVDGGRTTDRILAATTWLAGAALLPIAVSLGADLAIVVGHQFGSTSGIAIGLFYAGLALTGWYLAEWLVPGPGKKKAVIQQADTSIDVRVEHMLTEARVLLPGAQALLGFQLSILLTEGFASLPETLRLVHLVALCALALAIILLMAPAAFHRITFGGENTETFHRLGSALLLGAAAPLAIGITGDLYVAASKALESPGWGAAAAGAAALILLGLWLVQPLVLRARQ